MLHRVSARRSGCASATCFALALACGPVPLPARAEPPATQPPATASPSTEQAPAAPAGARGGYATIGAGASWPQPVRYSDDQLGPLLPIDGTVLSNPGVALDLGLGYDFGALRSELTWVHRQTSVDSSTWSAGPFPLAASRNDATVTSNSAFASLYLDLPVNARLVPYVGAGLGYTKVSASPTTLTLGAFSQSFGGGSGGLFGYQAKAGLAYQASPHTDLFAEAVYQGAPARTQGSLERSALGSWGLRLGVRVRFQGASLPQR